MEAAAATAECYVKSLHAKGGYGMRAELIIGAERILAQERDGKLCSCDCKMSEASCFEKYYFALRSTEYNGI